MSRLVLKSLLNYRLLCMNLTKCRPATVCCAVSPYKLGRLHDHHWQVARSASHQQTHWIKTETENTKINGLLNKLKTQQQALGYANYEHLQKIINLLERETSLQLTSEEGLLLLQASGLLLPTQNAETRWLLFDKIWNILSDKSILNKQHFNMRFEVMKYNYIRLTNVQEFLKQYPHELNIEFFTNLLEIVSSTQNLQQTEEVLLEMTARGLNYNARHYYALLQAYGNENALTQKVLEDIRKADTPIDAFQTHFATILGNLQSNLSEETLKLLNERKDYEVPQLIQMLRAAFKNPALQDIVLKQIIKMFPYNYLTQLELPIEITIICIEMISER